MNSTDLLIMSSFKFELQNNMHIPDEARRYLEDRIDHLVLKVEDHYDGDLGEYLNQKKHRI